jgi:hypothetical protein
MNRKKISKSKVKKQKMCFYLLYAQRHKESKGDKPPFETHFLGNYSATVCQDSFLRIYLTTSSCNFKQLFLLLQDIRS